MIDFEYVMKALALLLSLVVMLVAVSLGYPQLVVPMMGVVMSLLRKGKGSHPLSVKAHAQRGMCLCLFIRNAHCTLRITHYTLHITHYTLYNVHVLFF